jgi:hypothetical protein
MFGMHALVRNVHALADPPCCGNTLLGVDATSSHLAATKGLSRLQLKGLWGCAAQLKAAPGGHALCDFADAEALLSGARIARTARTAASEQL